MGPQARREYAAKMGRRYRQAKRAERGRLLDEFTAMTGLHRKYAIVLLGRVRAPRKGGRRGRPTRFEAEVVGVLVRMWEACDFPWSRRLHTMLPLWLPAARRSLGLTPELEALLLGMSPRTIDRLLHPHRVAMRRRIYGRTKPGTLLKHHVRLGIRQPALSGLVRKTQPAIHPQPAYHKNDNAHIEQKSWTHVRKIFGWKRIDSEEAVAAMNALYANEVRLLLNYFHTNVQLLEKRRVGSRVQRRYGPPMTPLDRLVGKKLIDVVTAATLLAHRASLDPFELVASVQRKVVAILAMPVQPIRKSSRGSLGSRTISPRQAERDARFEQAPVRSYVAR